MKVTSYSAFRASMKEELDAVCENHEPLIVTRVGEPVVIVSLDDYERLMDKCNFDEALFLLSGENFKQLLEAKENLEEELGKAIEPGAVIDDVLKQTVTECVNDFLEDHSIPPYTVVCDRTNNTDETFDKGELIVDIYENKREVKLTVTVARAEQILKGDKVKIIQSTEYACKSPEELFAEAYAFNFLSRPYRDERDF